MNEEPVELDKHRGMMAQKETDVRRRLSEVRISQAALKARREQFEQFLEDVPATSPFEAAVKAKYLLGLYAETQEGSHPQRARLILRSLAELDQFFGLSATEGDQD